MNVILETPRLLLRRFTPDDVKAMHAILGDSRVMYAYGYAFSEEDTQAWVNRQLQRYAENGYGMWAMVSKEDGCVIGACGITVQRLQSRYVPELGYLLRFDRWHKGYAAEAAAACKNHAFEALGLPEIYAIISNSNYPSRAVARKNGMVITGCLTKYYMGRQLPHLIYSVKRKTTV